LLSGADRAARVAEIHEPYHQAIAAEIVRRAQCGQETILVSLHSFTPALRANGEHRPWAIGVLHDRGNTSFAGALLADLRQDGALLVGDNEPYKLSSVGYTVPRHAYAAGLRYAELEIRQDLLMEARDLTSWMDILAEALPAAFLIKDSVCGPELGDR
jgi:predicted N-formylglutamate amidohydrolase